jgi:hypothetical protein
VASTSTRIYSVTRGRHIDAPPAAVREQVVDLHRWRAWSPWEDLDPELRRRYGGPDAGVGAWYEWEGNRKAGAGRMEIVDADDTSVTIDLRYLKPFRATSTARFTFDPAPSGTDVTWTVNGPKTLVTRIVGIFTSMDAVIGPDFEKGLDRLKATAEADAAGTGPA